MRYASDMHQVQTAWCRHRDTAASTGILGMLEAGKSADVFRAIKKIKKKGGT
jgi:hypothetical protein